METVFAVIGVVVTLVILWLFVQDAYKEHEPLHKRVRESERRLNIFFRRLDELDERVVDIEGIKEKLEKEVSREERSDPEAN